MPFVKLDCGILDSTLWVQPTQREVFITALLMAVPHELRDPEPQIEVRSLNATDFIVPPGWYGFVPAAGVGIIRRAQVEEKAGLDALEALGGPDAESRSKEHEGRRMVRIDGGYLILNFQKYRDRDYTGAERARRYRNRKASRCDGVESRCDITQAEEEAEEEALPVVNNVQELDSVGLTPNVGSLKGKKKVYREEAKQVLAFLNEKTGHAYREVDSNLKPIESILKSGVSLEDMRTVTMRKVRDWRSNPKMVEFLRPSTLYRRSNFEQYLGQTIKPEVDQFRGAI